MTVAYFDCFAGAGGDMIVGALLDAGADFHALLAHLSRLNVPGYTLRRETVRRSGLGGVQFHVEIAQGEPHQGRRHLKDILSLLDRAALPPRAAERARRIFTRLGEAEAHVHRIPLEEVHFHEVGAVDSIVDIVAACVALELLGVEEVFCSAIPAGSGTVQTEHGLLPVPAPATAELLKGVPVAACDVPAEMTTPTAAAVLTTLAKSYGAMPAMRVRAAGYGAGTRVTGTMPNLLRVILGEADAGGEADSVVELSANLDDCSGEILGATIERLLEAGCLDAWASAAVMKKNRPAWVLSALCTPETAEAAEEILFSETTTFGVRRRAASRSKLLRRHETVETPYGPVRIKIGRRGEKIVTASPEFSDCLQAARCHHVAVREVMAAAEALYRQGKKP
jgi:uncharacterized protein (TIGR00299 family) protein